MKVEFYILGLLLRYGPQHGYSLKKIIEREISDFAKIKLPTIYYNLAKLNNNGFVTAVLDKDGNRPEKFVYSITESGKKHFNEVFKKQLTDNVELEFALDGVLYFYDKFDNIEILNALIKKKEEALSHLEKINKHKQSSLNQIPKQGRKSAELIFKHHIYHLKAEITWLEEVIEGFSK